MNGKESGFVPALGDGALDSDRRTEFTGNRGRQKNTPDQNYCLPAICSKVYARIFRCRKVFVFLHVNCVSTLPYLQKTTAHSAGQTQLKEQTTLSRSAHTLRTEDAATVIFCRMAFRQPEMPEIASDAVFSTAIRRSSAESLVVRKSEMTKFA
jgi:hypothetical protein